MVLNPYLKRCKINNNEDCTFCRDALETIEHLLWYCPIIQIFLIQVMDLVSVLEFEERIVFNQNMTLEKIMFNFVYENPYKVGNFIILLTKQYTYRQLCAKERPNIETFKKYVLLIKKNVGKYNAVKNNMEDKFYKKNGMELISRHEIIIKLELL